jgi:hypothetical protein
MVRWTPIRPDRLRVLVALSGASIAAGCLAVGLLGTAAAAPAAEEAVLTCGDARYAVSGFGRGEPLHVSGGTGTYVVTYARVEPDGPVLLDTPGQRGGEDVVTCSATSPLSGRTLTFRGFFTPRGRGTSQNR